MRINPEKLRQRRRDKGFTQAQLAQRIGMEQSHISYVERGLKGLSLEALKKVAKALGVEIAELLVDDEDAGRYVRAGTSVVNIIRSDADTPEGLKALANDQNLIESFGITEEEWLALATIKLPRPANKRGYLHLLMTVRAI